MEGGGEELKGRKIESSPPEMPLPDDAGLQTDRAGERKKLEKWTGWIYERRSSRTRTDELPGCQRLAILQIYSSQRESLHVKIRIMPPQPAQHPSHFLARSRPRLRTLGEKGYRVSSHPIMTLMAGQCHDRHYPLSTNDGTAKLGNLKMIFVTGNLMCTSYTKDAIL